MLPIIRTFISLPAGVARMPFWRFSRADARRLHPLGPDARPSSASRPATTGRTGRTTSTTSTTRSRRRSWSGAVYLFDPGAAAQEAPPAATRRPSRPERAAAAPGAAAGRAAGPGGAAAGVELRPPRARAAAARLGLRRSAGRRAQDVRGRAARRARRPRSRWRCAGGLGRDPHLLALTLLPPAAAGLALRAADRAAPRRAALGGGRADRRRGWRCSPPTCGRSGATQADALDHLAVGRRPGGRAGAGRLALGRRADRRARCAGCRGPAAASLSLRAALPVTVGAGLLKGVARGARGRARRAARRRCRGRRARRSRRRWRRCRSRAGRAGAQSAGYRVALGAAALWLDARRAVALAQSPNRTYAGFHRGITDVPLPKLPCPPPPSSTPSRRPTHPGTAPSPG